MDNWIWHLSLLFQGNLQHEYAGSDSVLLDGPEVRQELISLLRYLNQCMYFSKKPYKVFLEFGGYDQSDVLIKKSKARVRKYQSILLSIMCWDSMFHNCDDCWANNFLFIPVLNYLLIMNETLTRSNPLLSCMQLLKPAFTVVRDRSSKCFLLFIRGAISVKERLTAATGAEVPFHHVVVQEGRVSNLVLGYAHCGMVAGARWIAKRVIPCLSKAVEQSPDYEVKVISFSSSEVVFWCLTTLNCQILMPLDIGSLAVALLLCNVEYRFPHYLLHGIGIDCESSELQFSDSV